MILHDRALSLLQQFDTAEFGLCLWFNRGCRRRWLQGLFGVISRLGDGVFWYGLMLVLPLVDGLDGLLASLHMAVVGATGVVLYRVLKTRLARTRPYLRHADIHPGAAPLDLYSFPSGHTLHAVGFGIVVLSHYPLLWPLVLPFVLLVAASRMVLGLHYPTDVIAGAAIGAAIAALSFAL